MVRASMFSWTLAVAVSIAPYVSFAAPGDYTIVQSFSAPTTSPDGLAVDGDYLWNSDCMIPKLFKIEKATGKVVETHDLSMVEGHEGTTHETMIMPDHVEVVGDGTLFINDHEGKEVIYQLDPMSMKILKHLDIKYSENMGVAWDGNLLWNLEPFGKKIHAIDVASGEEKKALPTPDSNSCGVAWDGQCLWVSDLTTKRLYLLDPTDGSVEMSLEVPGPSTKLPTGIAPDRSNGHIWFADEDSRRATIYELKVEYPSSGPCARGEALSSQEDQKPKGCSIVGSNIALLGLLLIPAFKMTRRRSSR